MIVFSLFLVKEENENEKNVKRWALRATSGFVVPQPKR
jgi:hypothetical protein